LSLELGNSSPQRRDLIARRTRLDEDHVTLAPIAKPQLRRDGIEHQLHGYLAKLERHLHLRDLGRNDESLLADLTEDLEELVRSDFLELEADAPSKTAWLGLRRNRRQRESSRTKSFMATPSG
jgi:hypothetical protein